MTQRLETDIQGLDSLKISMEHNDHTPRIAKFREILSLLLNNRKYEDARLIIFDTFSNLDKLSEAFQLAIDVDTRFNIRPAKWLI